VAHQGLRVVTVEAKEVDQLGGRIDLGLNKKNRNLKQYPTFFKTIGIQKITAK
jgi:hypothetical protein